MSISSDQMQVERSILYLPAARFQHVFFAYRLVNFQMNGRMNERTRERANERTIERTNETVGTDTHVARQAEIEKKEMKLYVCIYGYGGACTH
jgi:hypothetical protein